MRQGGWVGGDFQGSRIFEATVESLGMEEATAKGRQAARKEGNSSSEKAARTMAMPRDVRDETGAVLTKGSTCPAISAGFGERGQEGTWTREQKTHESPAVAEDSERKSRDHGSAVSRALDKSRALAPLRRSGTRCRGSRGSSVPELHRTERPWMHTKGSLIRKTHGGGEREKESCPKGGLSG